MGNFYYRIRRFRWEKNKVTRRLPELSVAETKMFSSKEEAKKQFNEWLN